MKILRFAQHFAIGGLAVVFFGPSVWAQSNVAKGPFDNPFADSPLPPEEQFKGRMVVIESILPTFGEEGPLDAEVLERRRQFILNTPDIAPYLVAIADARIQQKLRGVCEVFNAMSMRNDIDPAAIARYIIRAEAMMHTLTTRNSMSDADYNYLEGVAKILEVRPSPESERILIRMLEVGAVDPAAKALARMGTSASLPALEAVVEKFSRIDKERGDNALHPWLDRLTESLATLRHRVSKGKNATEDDGVPGGGTEEPSFTQRPQNTVSNESRGPQTLWLITGAVVVGAAIVLLWIMVWKRTRS